LESLFMKTGPVHQPPVTGRLHLTEPLQPSKGEFKIRPVPYQVGNDGLGLGFVGIF
jgi:hypothetical protein